jgi:DNA polymerase III sliding clamp (beta) subunit (PCNA family)
MIVVYRLNSNNTVYRFNFFYISEGESNYTLKQELKFVSTEPLKDATLDSDHLIIVLSNYTRVLKAVNGQYVDVQNITDKNFTVAAARNGTLVATDRKNHYIYKATAEFERSHGEELAE